ncbi:hypothetical protein [Streptomyces sp. NPDC059757]|uniref:hypothetical protein n=1 Tax=Streptomyces sp. NPDC059757 TaxID=3346935 RepID=UPI003664317B
MRRKYAALGLQPSDGLGRVRTEPVHVRQQDREPLGEAVVVLQLRAELRGAQTAAPTRLTIGMDHQFADSSLLDAEQAQLIAHRGGPGQARPDP